MRDRPSGPLSRLAESIVRSKEMDGHASKRRLALVGLAVISIFGFASCDWSQFRLTVTHTGDNETETAISTSNVSNLTLRFTATAGSFIGRSSPAVVKGVVYIGGVGNLYAFDAAGNTNCSGVPKTCAPLCTASVDASLIQSSPAVVNGVLYIGGGGGNLYAFDAAGNTNCSGVPKTCTPLWTASTGTSIASSPAVVNGVVYIGSLNGLYAFDAGGTSNCSGTPKTCAPLWTALSANDIESSPSPTGSCTSARTTARRMHSTPGGPRTARQHPRCAGRCGPTTLETCPRHLL